MAPLKVLIAGAGISGPAAVYWLSRLPGGAAITVVERAQAVRPGGHQIDIRGQGITVIQRMGLEAKMRANVVREEGTCLVRADNKVVAALPAAPMNAARNNRQSITTEFEMMRGTMCKVLMDAAEGQATYRYGVHVTAIEEDTTGVAVTLSDGTSQRFDLVVGADGLGSGIRQLMLGKDAPSVYHPIGLYIAYFDVPRREGDRNWFTFYLAPGRRMINMRGGDPHTHQVMLSVAARNPNTAKLAALLRGRAPVDEVKRAWAELYRGAGWHADRIANCLLDEASTGNFYTHELAQVRMEAWHTGRVALVGDAGWAPTPFTGIGSTIALVGVYVLAGELARHTDEDGTVDVPAALRAYDKRVRPYVTEAQKRLPRDGFNKGFFPPETRLGIWILQTVLAIVVWTRLDKLLSRFTSDEIDWALPDYPELGS